MDSSKQQEDSIFGSAAQEPTAPSAQAQSQEAAKDVSDALPQGSYSSLTPSQQDYLLEQQVKFK